MTEEQLAELERLHRAATQGEWRVARHPANLKTAPWKETVGIEAELNFWVPSVLCWTTRGADEGNAASIAANHNAMDYLLSAARREKVLREALEPFVKIADFHDGMLVTDATVIMDFVPLNAPKISLTLGMCRAARAALEGANTNERPHP